MNERTEMNRFPFSICSDEQKSEAKPFCMLFLFYVNIFGDPRTSVISYSLASSVVAQYSIG